MNVHWVDHELASHRTNCTTTDIDNSNSNAMSIWLKQRWKHWHSFFFIYLFSITDVCTCDFLRSPVPDTIQKMFMLHIKFVLLIFICFVSGECFRCCSRCVWVCVCLFVSKTTGEKGSQLDLWKRERESNPVKKEMGREREKSGMCCTRATVHSTNYDIGNGVDE